MVVEMAVRMDCKGCERSVRKALSRIRGIASLDIDPKQSKVTVRGYVDRMMVLRAVRRGGRRAEFWSPQQQQQQQQRDEYHHRHIWPSSGPSIFGGQLIGHPAVLVPTTSNAFSRTYNYEHHGYNTTDSHYYSYYHFATPAAADGLTTFFSDDDPNACSIM